MQGFWLRTRRAEGVPPYKKNLQCRSKKKPSNLVEGQVEGLSNKELQFYYSRCALNLSTTFFLIWTQLLRIILFSYKQKLKLVYDFSGFFAVFLGIYRCQSNPVRERVCPRSEAGIFDVSTIGINSQLIYPLTSPKTQGYIEIIVKHEVFHGKC